MDLVSATEILKTLYGCSVVFLAVSGDPAVIARRARYACERKLLAARRRGDVWALDVHKDHLVGFDRARLRSTA